LSSDTELAVRLFLFFGASACSATGPAGSEATPCRSFASAVAAAGACIGEVAAPPAAAATEVS